MHWIWPLPTSRLRISPYFPYCVACDPMFENIKIRALSASKVQETHIVMQAFKNIFCVGRVRP